MRRKLREDSGVFQIVKNTLFSLAFEQAGIPIPTEQMQGTVAAGYCLEEVPPVARTLRDYCFFPITSITTTPDGKVWLGMIYRHGIVYFDGREWRTMQGDVLPYIAEEPDAPRFHGGDCVIPGDLTVDLAVTQDGDLLALTYMGIFRFVGDHIE